MVRDGERRRESSRAKVFATVWVRDTAETRAPLTAGSVRDLSQGGMRFEGKQKFSENSFLYLLIETGHGLVKASGRVAHVRAKPEEEGLVETGVAFFDFDPYAREAISSIISKTIH